MAVWAVWGGLNSISEPDVMSIVVLILGLLLFVLVIIVS